MVQLQFFRPEKDRVDTTILMMPDLNATPGLMPTPEEYKALEERLQKQLADKLAIIEAEQYVPPEKPPVEILKIESVSESGVESANPIDAPINESSGDSGAKDQVAVAPVLEEKPAENGETKVESGKTKKHWSELQETIKTLKVAELKDELETRGLDTKGVKNSLIQRLQEALDKEKVAEETQPIETEETQPEVDAEAEQPVEKMETEEAIEPEKLEEVIDAEELVEKKDDEKEEKEEEKPAMSEKELEELKKATEKFEKLKKEKKAALERHYSFPKEPAILIFPSKIAKGGKFECKVSSIQSLLDYRLEDNKEASFEAFLFAESFREMLDRSNAFAIYYNLNCALDRDAERKSRDEALTATEEKLENAEETPKPDGDKKEEAKEAPKQKEPPKEDLRTKFKALVNYANNFTAFAHFDQNIVGHLVDYDLEQIIHTLGLNISRGDIQRLIKKFVAHDQVNYRNYTDKWVDKDGNVKYIPTPRPEAPSMGELLSGHKDESDAMDATATLGSTPDVTDTGIVFYKGTVLNINHVLGQQRKVEADRELALIKVEELEGNLKTTKDERDRLEKKRKNLTADVDHYKKKLYDTEKCLKKSDDDTVKMKTTLSDFRRLGEKVILMVEKVMPSKKKEEIKEKDKSSATATGEESQVVADNEKSTAAASDETSQDSTKADEAPLASSEELLVADEAHENGDVSNQGESMDTSVVKSAEQGATNGEEPATA